jgi:hypothetical protein
MMDAAAGEAARPRAFLKIGTGTIARHQLALALALDCTLVVCLARELAPEVVELQHISEQASVRFHAVTGARALVPLITASDEVVVISDGLLAAPRSAIPLLEAGNAVLVQPVESGTAAGFERIDLNHASAGLMRIPGRLVERLAELEPDVDAISALTRLALQSGIAQRLVPAEAREGVRWSLVHSESEAGAIEPGWIALHNVAAGPVSPGSLLARLGVRQVGPAMLHAGSGGNLPSLASLAMGAIALGLGWIGWTTVALILSAIAWIGLGYAAMLRGIERESLCRGPDRLPRDAIFLWLHDAMLVVIIVWNQTFAPWIGLLERAFAPVMLICILRMLPRVFSTRWIAWVKDRAFLALMLAIASGLGNLNIAIPVVAIILGVVGIALPVRQSRLTRV